MRNSLPIWNPFEDGFNQNSFAFLNNIRKNNPIHKSIGGQWFFSKYDDVRSILTDPNFETVDIKQVIFDKAQFRKDGGNFDEIYNGAVHWFMFKNQPEHMAIRKLVASFWNEFKLEKLIDVAIIDCIEAVKNKESIDFSTDFAEPISTKVMCGILGFDEKDGEYLMNISHNLLHIVEPFNSIYSYIQENKVVGEFSIFLDQVLIKKTNSPDESMISKLITDSPYTNLEVKSVIMLLLFTGMESSTYFLSTSFYTLLKHPFQWKKLKEDTTNIQTAIEELIRHVSITKCLFRKAVKVIVFDSTVIQKDEVVIVSLESANHDESVFDQSDELILNRKPNPHVAFGYGFHSCLGAKLARLEGQLLFKKLAESNIDFQLSTIPPKWRKNILISGIESLPLNISYLS